MAEVHEGDFEGLVEGEGSWFGCWFVPEGFLFRAVMSVADWLLFGPVVRWFCSGLFRFGLSILLVFYPYFLSLVGSLFSWWVLPLMNKPHNRFLTL